MCVLPLLVLVLPLLVLVLQHNALSGGSWTVDINYAQMNSNTDINLYECSGHGVCDKTNGKCNCWEYWGSSDGYSGAIGTSDDCGYNLIN